MLVHELLQEAEELEGTARALTFIQELKDLGKKHGFIIAGDVKFRHQKAMTPSHYDINVAFGASNKMIRDSDADEISIEMRLLELDVKKWLDAKQGSGLSLTCIDSGIHRHGSGTTSGLQLACKLYLPLHQKVKHQLRLMVFGYVLPPDLKEPLVGPYEKLHDGKKPPYPYFSEPISTSVDHGALLELRHHLNPSTPPDRQALDRFAIALAERYSPKLKGKAMGIRRGDSTIPASIITDEELENGFPVVSALHVNKTSGRTTEVPEGEFLDLFVQFFPKLKHLAAK